MNLTQAASDAVLLAQFGREALKRGRALVRESRVSLIDFDPGLSEVYADVRTRSSLVHEVSVSLDLEPPFEHRGVCDCPWGGDCSHAVATILAARVRTAGTSLLRVVEAIRPADPAVQPPSWERDLSPLVVQPKPVGVPLALRLEVRRLGAMKPLVQCRPVVRSAQTGRWIQTGAGWPDVMADFRRRFPPEQVHLLKRLVATVSGGPGSMPSYYGFSGTGWLRLDAAEDGLWAILTRLVRSGVTVVGEHEHDVVRLAHHRPRIEVDIAAGDGLDLLVSPRLMVEGLDPSATLVVPIGDPVHGVAVVRDLPGRRGAAVELMQLADPVPASIATWVAERREIPVPAADRERFVRQFLPALREQVVVTCGDGSVDLPEPAEPRVRLEVHHAGAERVELRWRVGYGDEGTEYDLDGPVEGAGRDADAEQSLWFGLTGVLDAGPQALVDPRQPGRPRGRAELTGWAAAEFAGERLAALEAAGVEVRHSGERIDYRRADAPPTVHVSVQDPSSGDGELSERRSGSDWFDLGIEVTVGGESVPFGLLFRALATEAEHLVLPSGLYFSLDQPEFRQLAELIEEARAVQDRDRPGSLRINPHQAGLWDELCRLGVVDQQAARWAEQVAGLTGLTEPEAVPVPVGVNADLRPYQVDGYRWLHQLWRLGLGGILADDMGLGKTLQALTLIAQVRATSPAGAPPFLIVAPTSVVSIWLTEVARFAPGLRVVGLTRTEAKRGRTLIEEIAEADLVITSYTLLRLDADHYESIPWQGLILDEAQFVKNHQAKTYASVRRLAVGFTIAMTGTPLENSLMDLWSMLSLTAPGMFPHPGRFSDYYRRPIERSGHPERLARLRDRVRPLMLRRTKQEVASDLPEKQEQVIEVDLHPRHARIYQLQLQRERQKILGLIGDLDSNRFAILRSLTLLRQLSLDAALIDPEHEGVPSAKIDLLVDMVASLAAEGHRALVFSQFTTFLQRVADRLTGAGVDCSYLDGSTQDRARVIQDFKSGRSGAFLISLKAGGFGLNLTEADYCFVLDPWWNPASEAQAVDRAHRIGQTRPVMVYRLVSKDTIEDKVMELKSRKQQLFDSVMSADGLLAGALSATEIRSLLAG